ncbi:MAG: 4-hydroxy-tetrahydrodipicolinate reductase [Candidatus Nomurabacteria bacterium]|nr:4-hydroxy-tetrahydrodipicolinate reductase [Candidatus Nomurabacteria bacterium]
MKSKIKIALIGFGKMGHEIDALCRDSENFEVVSTSFKKNKDESLDLEGIAKADIAIDFTSKDVVLKNIEQIAKLGKNLVIGTTGWYGDMEKVKKIVEKYKIGLIYGANFSVGANIFLKMVANSSKLFAKFPEYDVYGFEVHHSGKLDSPSGTALKIAGKILENFPAKKSIQTEKLNRQINPNELHFASVRGGRNPGFHEVVFDSNADGITLSHQAYGRVGFAKGSLLAAEFIKNKKGMYSFEDIL